LEVSRHDLARGDPPGANGSREIDRGHLTQLVRRDRRPGLCADAGLEKGAEGCAAHNPAEISPSNRI